LFEKFLLYLQELVVTLNKFLRAITFSVSMTTVIISILIWFAYGAFLLLHKKL